jgi:ribosomal protein S18 acetylase RimI-like enzyme
MLQKQQSIIPDISELYSLTQDDYNFASSLLGDAFRVDPIWSQILKDEPSKFSQAFGFPLKYTLKYGRVYAPDNQKLAIAAWLPTPYVDMNIWQLFRSGSLSVAMKLGMKVFKKITQVFQTVDNDRKLNITGQYINLFVLGVAPTQQKKGLGTLLVQKMIDHLPSGIPLYLETETESNVKFYERLGFHVLKEINVPILDLPMWEMLYSGK